MIDPRYHIYGSFHAEILWNSAETPMASKCCKVYRMLGSGEFSGSAYGHMLPGKAQPVRHNDHGVVSVLIMKVDFYGVTYSGISIHTSLPALPQAYPLLVGKTLNHFKSYRKTIPRSLDSGWIPWYNRYRFQIRLLLS